MPKQAQSEVYEIVDSNVLAERWQVRGSWVRNHTVDEEDPIPHLKMGRYVRFQWGHPALLKWLARRQRG